MKFLPKISKKFLLIALTCLFFLVSPVSAATSSLNETASPTNGQPTTPSYKIVPIPPATSSSQITPLPTPNQNPNIQLAGTPWGWLGDRVGDILSLFKEATLKLVEAALYIVEHAGLAQILADSIGKVDDLLGAAASGDRAQVYQVVNDVAANPDSLGSGGLLGMAQQTTNGLLALPIPVSTGQYLASINPFGQAQAASGEELLKGNSGAILDIWKKVRDASFALSVVILVVIGFMVMFRLPLNPRTVVTAQNALPRIVIALLLIFFSFAIAGLMIDITRIISSFLDNLIVVPISAKAGIFGIFFMIAASLTLLLTGLAAATGPVGVGIALAILLLCLILAIIMLVVFMVLIFKLVTRYVIFLLLTMFAPIFFLFGALPGAEGLIITWFKRAAAALLAIPFTGLVINLSLQIGFSGFRELDSPVPEFEIMPLNLLGGALNNAFAWFFIAPIIGLAMFFFATKVPDIVDEMFGNRPLAARAGIGPGAIFIAPFGALGRAGKAVGGIGQLEHAIGHPGLISGAAAGFLKRVKCLSSKSLIDTPLGAIPVNKLKEGTLVWSTGLKGEKIAARILRKSKTFVSKHFVSHLVLADGRGVFVSPRHPTTDGRIIADLMVGATYDGSMVVSNKLVAYKQRFTYDILPDSPTGHYWADGILMGSTLSPSPIKTVYTKFVSFFRTASPG